MKKQNIAKNGIKKPLTTSFVLLTASVICKTLPWVNFRRRGRVLSAIR